jgi:hypothetical protein
MTIDEKPFSQACENNKQAILTVIQPLFSKLDKVLEIGSGTGQHSVFFAEQMPRLIWQPSDQAEYLPGVRAWGKSADLSNLLEPLELDVRKDWPIDSVSGIFIAKTVHIMSWDIVELFFAGVEKHLTKGGALCVYGPFNYYGRYSSDSNAAFDRHLKSRDPQMGIRDFEAVVELANQHSLMLVSDSSMPANNRILTFARR